MVGQHKASVVPMEAFIFSMGNELGLKTRLTQSKIKNSVPTQTISPSTAIEV